MYRIRKVSSHVCVCQGFQCCLFLRCWNCSDSVVFFYYKPFITRLQWLGLIISDLRLKFNYQQSGEISGKKGERQIQIQKKQFHPIQVSIRRFQWLDLIKSDLRLKSNYQHSGEISGKKKGVGNTDVYTKDNFTPYRIVSVDLFSYC